MTPPGVAGGSGRGAALFLTRERARLCRLHLDGIVPVAEDAGVKLALHPDDPPLSPVRGVGRIMVSPEHFQRALDLVPSEVNGMTLCQGCFSEMGVDVPREIARSPGRGA